MDITSVLNEAKRMCTERRLSAPDFEVFGVIDKQLDYMQDLLGESNIDRSKFRHIDVGIYAVREFEESDPEFAGELKKVQYIADKISKGLKVS